MGAYDAGALFPYDYVGSVRIPIFGVALNSFVNRTPLYTRLPQAPLGGLSFKTSSVLYRPSSTTINNSGVVLIGDLTFVVTDASMFQTGDVIEIESEELLITTVVPSTNTLTVTRAYAGTSAAQHADSLVVYLVSNTRTGSETNVTGISRVPTVITQNAQTIQHPYHVGGSLNSATEFALPPGVTSVLGKERMMAIRDASDDMERSFYYGRTVALASTTTKPQMTGLRSLITTNSVTNATNKTAYKPSDLVRDTTQPIFSAGGNPDIMLMSADWMTALTIWNVPVVRLEAGATDFGVAIDMFECPFLNGITIIPAPLLRSGTVITLSSSEVRNRVKRAMFDKPRGSTGDADQGDIIAEGAIELDNESHHAYLSGITAWAQQS